jgi:hypothetical protein
VVPSHEVFQKPLKVDLRFEDHAVPDNYRHYPGGEKLGKRIKVWKVQTKKFPEIDPGLVSDPYGFSDSPDAEVISSGINSKAPDSVALGRHGNFFLWGFSASPPDMTPEARKCFVNAVCYIKKFDGQKPFVRKTQSGREWALVYAGYVKQLSDRAFVDNLFPLNLFPEELRRRFGKDPEKYRAYYEENLEYLTPSRNGYAVDEDVKALGLANRNVALLEKCVALLERGEQTERAARILKRYTNEKLTDPKDWRSWLRQNRSRLFFTDTGGFKFLVAPEALIAELRRRGPSLDASTAAQEPDAQRPVVATAELSPATCHAGASADLIIRAKVAPGWHIYSAESNGPGIPTTLRLKLPGGVEAEGEWSYPTPIAGSDHQMVYEGTLEFQRKLRIKTDAAVGLISVTCELGYQACDPFLCRAPTKVELVAAAEVVAAVAAAGR